MVVYSRITKISIGGYRPMADKQYSVLHEIGDYYRANPVSENDNKIINEQLKDINKETDKKDKDNNK